MSERYPGGIISQTAPVPSGPFETSAASGVWTMEQAAYWQQQGNWPIPGNVQLFVDDVFSTYLYTGTVSAISIGNGINLGGGYVGGGNGGGGYFDGVNDYLSVPTGTALSLTGDFTVECFVYQTNSVGYQGIFSNGEYPSSGQVVIGIADGNPIFYMSNGSSWITFITPTTIIPNNSWTHMAVTCSGSTFTMWINGVSVGTSSYSGTRATPESTSVIGRLYPVTDGFYINAYLSNVRVVKGTALYTSTFTPPSSALTAVSGTQLLCCQGTAPFVDNSPNALTITVNGSTAISSLGPFPFTIVAGKGGLVWIKDRNSGAKGHALFDTVRGGDFKLQSQSATNSSSIANQITSFNSNGFSLGTNGDINSNSILFCSWTFAEQAKFFDVVTYTGTGSARTVAHNLGSVPGMIIVKRTDASANWRVYHRSTGKQSSLFLNLTNAASTGDTDIWNDTDPTSTVFSVGTNVGVNDSGGSYVAYIFAHDAGGFGSTGTENVISCGSFVADGSGKATVNLGYEPQYFLFKPASTTGNWAMNDTMRGMSNNSYALLYSNLSDAEGADATDFYVVPGSTGIANIQYLTAGVTYIYMSVRRPMKAPITATQVFQPVAYTGTDVDRRLVDTGIVTDMVMARRRDITTPSALGFALADRLRSVFYVGTATTSTQNRDADGYMQFVAAYGDCFSAMNGVSVGNNVNLSLNQGSTPQLAYAFKRASGFFDMVRYTGTGVTRTVTHNLTAIPEMMWVIGVTGGGGWLVYAATLGANKTLELSEPDAARTDIAPWNNTTPTASVFTVTSGGNTSGYNYMAYLFATIPGISKVGSYTGTGATQTINCGFIGGARFVLIKRTDASGTWWTWDTARGMRSGTDPRMPVDSTGSESNADWVYTVATGFQIVTTDASVNASGGNYIFLAIA